MIRDSKQTFGVVTQLLHWSMVILLIGLFTVGLYMTGLEYYDALYHILPWWHKSLGVIVFILLLFRFFWRLSNQQPEELETHKWWEKRLAHLIQNGFYLLILVICISGYIISTAKGDGIELFSWFEIPAIVSEVEEEQADFIGLLHKFMAIGFAILVVLHAMATFKHHFIDKDKTLKRMLGSFNKKSNQYP